METYPHTTAVLELVLPTIEVRATQRNALVRSGADARSVTEDEQCAALKVLEASTPVACSNER